MENITDLISHFEDHNKIQFLISSIKNGQRQKIRCKNLVGATDVFAIAAGSKALKGAHIVIAFDKEEAAYLYNDLDGALEGKRVFFLPDSMKRPLFFDKIENQNVLQRTEMINKISTFKEQDYVIITYPEAILEKVANPNVLSKHRLTFEKESILNTSNLAATLFEFGFIKEEFVYEPGQFSIRGDIVDIYSYGNEWPYRIALFDDEIESIRTFNPTTQLSLKNIGRVSIIPSKGQNEEDNGQIGLLSILPDTTTVWINDYASIFATIDKVEETFDEKMKKGFGEDDVMESFLKGAPFVSKRQIQEGIDNLNVVSLRKDFGPKDEVEVIEFDSVPQPDFNKNIHLLVTDLQANTAKGFTNFIFTSSPKQIERFYSIFKDMGEEVQFIPINNTLKEGFISRDLKVACYTDHQIFQRFHKYRLRKGFTKDMALSLKMLKELNPGDFVTHIDHGVGRFSGLEKININGHLQESVRLVYKNNDLLYVSINTLHKISKYTGKDGTAPALHKLGSDAWSNLKRRAKKKVKDIAKDLIALYAKRKASKGFACKKDGYLQHELEASFMYEDTPDQMKTTVEVKKDMEREKPMDRLVCGDVGFGKTEIAIRAAFKAVVNGKQVAILVPTTILALQHFKTFNERFQSFGISVDYINRFKTAKQKKASFELLKEGKLDIIIGTHGLLSKSVGFKDLGLLVIDEEQKFGVAAKEKIRTMAVDVDTLTLTATPIPRTLQFSLMAARDMSVMRTPPPNRQPIYTEVRVFNDRLIKEAIEYEIQRGGQVFFVHNRVKSLPDIEAMVKRLVPSASVIAAHGQLEPKKLEQSLMAFIEGRYDVLVSTNIIETGLDIPNANTIIINNAHHFGMSDLHQLRGRVGRSNRKAFCYLFSPPMTTITTDARKRLRALEDFSDLGSGFEIAMRDLDIRGAGNLLGGEQSGFISDIGFSTFQKILDEAMKELKEKEFKSMFEGEEHEYIRDVTIEVDMEMLIPDNYISNVQERLSIYTRLDLIESDKGIYALSKELEDRFGTIPTEVKELFNGLKLRRICKKMGFEKVVIKNDQMKAFFVLDPQSSFYETKIFGDIVNYVTINGPKIKAGFKKTPRSFIFVAREIETVREAQKVLSLIYENVAKK